MNRESYANLSNNQKEQRATVQSLKDINWNHLYCFYEVAKAQSLKKGAESAGLAPSTISEQIKKLEEKFEKKLFNRSTKVLTLTQEGVELYERAKIIFEEGHKLLEQFSESTLGGYSIKIGIEETISNNIASEFASQYWDYYTPFGSVNTIRQSDHNVLIENLVSGSLDWGISLRAPKRKSLDYEKIGSFEIVFCCQKDLFQKFKTPEDILINIPFVETSLDKTLNLQILKHLRSKGIIPKETIYSDHHEYIKKLLIRGRCVAFFPKNPLEDYEGLQTFQFGDPLSVNLYAVWSKENSNLISIKVLKKLLKSKISTLPERYEDVNLQIEISDVEDDALKN